MSIRIMDDDSVWLYLTLRWRWTRDGSELDRSYVGSPFGEVLPRWASPRYWTVLEDRTLRLESPLAGAYDLAWDRSYEQRHADPWWYMQVSVPLPPELATLARDVYYGRRPDAERVDPLPV